MDQAFMDQSMKIDTLQEEALKHAKHTTDTLAKEIARSEKIMSTMDVFVKSQFGDLRRELVQSYQENQTWQVNFEDMEAKKIMEIQTAVKVLN